MEEICGGRGEELGWLAFIRGRKFGNGLFSLLPRSVGKRNFGLLGKTFNCAAASAYPTRHKIYLGVGHRSDRFQT